ncbi:MAG: hypothetical protein A2W19_06070 [Spirochaetes bacterium RBG_16_49_21]|nr:MAG: hypothetical protein A2W19_06070 [Spirochaetes bacterium RBG_16_49_21]
MTSRYPSIGKLTLKLEWFTNLFLFPLTIYYAQMLTVYSAEEKAAGTVINLVGLFFVVFNVLIHLMIRVIKLRPILKSLRREDRPLTAEELKKLKRKLLSYPFSEAIIIALRWIIADMTIFSLNVMMFGVHLLRAVNVITSILIIVPIAMVHYFSVSENFTAAILENPLLIGVEIERESYWKFSFPQRILFLVFAVAVIPTCVFGSFLVISSLKIREYTNIFLHVSIIIGGLAFAIIYECYNASRLIKNAVKKNIGVMNDFKQGKLNVSAPIITSSEMAEMAGSINITLRTVSGLIRKIYETIRDIDESSSLIAGTMRLFSENTQSQATSTEEVSATIEEMSAGVENVSNLAERQYQLFSDLIKTVDELSTAAERIQADMSEMIRLTDSISSDVKLGESTLLDMTNSMSKITESSDEMLSIIGIINDISEMINLLSLNAAIEAARAGDAGRGFAVVADEVSKLADRTSASIKDIDSLIKVSNEEIKSGMDKVTGAVSSFKKIIEGVTSISRKMSNLSSFLQKQAEVNAVISRESKNVMTHAEEIRYNMREQKNAVGEIVTTVSGINEASQSTAAGTEEITAKADDLAQLAKSLRDYVKFFEV